MKRIIALILSALMSILSALGIVVPKDETFTQGEWVDIVVSEFGIINDAGAVAAAEEWGILDGVDFNAEKYATNKFVNATIANAAKEDVATGIANNGRKAKLSAALEALDAAVALRNNQVVSEVPQSDFVPQAGVADLSDKDYSVVGGKLVYAAADFALAAGDKFIAGANDANISGAAYEVKAVEVADGAAIVDVEEIALEDAVEAIDFEGSVDADFNQAVVYDNQGNLIENDAEIAGAGAIKDAAGKLVEKGTEEVVKFLTNPKVSFSVKGFKVKASYSGGNVALSVGGTIPKTSVNVEKSYLLSNIKYDAKYDANLAKLQIKEAYLKMNYDLVETTVLEGSYAASVVPEGGSFTNEGESFLDKVKNNLSNLTLAEGSGIKVNVFTFDFPIGSTGLTVRLDVSLSISANGRIEIIVTSNETKGYEIINNKGRVIHESTVYDRAFNISGDFRVVLGLSLGLTALGVQIVDVEFNGGIGAYVLTKVFNVKTHATATSEVPLDVAVEAAAGLDNLADLRFCADVQLYGILSVSVGQNSIIRKIGLSKTWSFYDRGNGTFATLHIENSGIVDHCSYAA
jgi:hypothetical protein